MHEPRPDFVSVSSLLALFQDSTATAALTRAQTAAWRAPRGDTQHADRALALTGDAPAPFLRYLIGDFYEHVGAFEASLAAITRAAAETPCWDPMLVAWAYNGVAGALGHLGRFDEARDVLSALWAYDPFYPNALDTAARVGAPPPEAVTPRGRASSLRLALANQLYGDNREPGFRATAMAMSFVWEGQHLAAASMAELGARLPGPDPAWPRAIASYARAAAARTPGTLPALPAGGVAARVKAVRAAHKAGEHAVLEVAAHDPELAVARAAWAALLEVGHRADELGALIHELVAATTSPRGQPILAMEIGAVLQGAPLPAIWSRAPSPRSRRAPTRRCRARRAPPRSACPRASRRGSRWAASTRSRRAPCSPWCGARTARCSTRCRSGWRPARRCRSSSPRR
jgi:tetratricopeptide (TPR) repeat protein